MPIHPYLFFTNTCREAMTRYHEILGGELFVMTVGDMPEGEERPPGAPDDLVIHAAITFDDGSLLMASDDPTGDAAGTKGVAISVTAADPADCTRIFNALAEGGEVTGKLEQTFFSPLFGMCTDRFGTSWMVMVDADEQA